MSERHQDNWTNWNQDQDQDQVQDKGQGQDQDQDQVLPPLITAGSVNWEPQHNGLWAQEIQEGAVELERRWFLS